MESKDKLKIFLEAQKKQSPFLTRIIQVFLEQTNDLKNLHITSHRAEYSENEVIHSLGLNADHNRKSPHEPSKIFINPYQAIYEPWPLLLIGAVAESAVFELVLYNNSLLSQIFLQRNPKIDLHSNPFQIHLAAALFELQREKIKIYQELVAVHPEFKFTHWDTHALVHGINIALNQQVENTIPLPHEWFSIFKNFNLRDQILSHGGLDLEDIFELKSRIKRGDPCPWTNLLDLSLATPEIIDQLTTVLFNVKDLSNDQNFQKIINKIFHLPEAEFQKVFDYLRKPSILNPALIESTLLGQLTSAQQILLSKEKKKISRLHNQHPYLLAALFILKIARSKEFLSRKSLDSAIYILENLNIPFSEQPKESLELFSTTLNLTLDHLELNPTDFNSEDILKIFRAISTSPLAEGYFDAAGIKRLIELKNKLPNNEQTSDLIKNLRKQILKYAQRLENFEITNLVYRHWN